MKLFAAAVLTALLGMGAIAVAASGRTPSYPPRHAARRAVAERICRAQGPRCRVVQRPGQPRDLTGLGCVCE